MTRRTVSIVLLFLGVMAIAVFGVAQDAPTEAPAGFETFTLVENPGSQSHSNGIPEPVAGDTYAIDQTIYEQENDPTTGLGPLYNARACADCHQNPVSGGSSQFTELRVGHLDENGVFQNPMITIADSPVCVPGQPTCITGRSIVNDRVWLPKLRSTSRQPRTFVPCERPSTPWAMALSRQLTTRR